MKIVLFVVGLSSCFSAFADMEVPDSAKYHSSERTSDSVAGSKSYKGVVNGVSYSRYSDGSAGFHNGPKKITSLSDWSVGCDSDEMTDKKTCNVSNSESKIFIWLEKGKGIESLSLYSHDFPGRNMAIRIGSAKPIISRKFISGRSAQNLIAQMKPGTIVKTRYYSWPYDSAKDAKVTIKGNSLSEALRYSKWVLAGSFEPVNDSVTAQKAAVLTPKIPKQAVSVGGLGHMHGDRSHSHSLPKVGKAHRHGSGPLGE